MQRPAGQTATPIAGPTAGPTVGPIAAPSMGPTMYPTMLPATPTTAPTANSPIYVGNNGYIHGIDGMLDQISGSLVKQAMPIIQNDRALQETIGGAAGQAMAKPLWFLSGVAALYVGYKIFQDYKRQNPRRSRPRRSSRRSRRFA